MLEWDLLEDELDLDGNSVDRAQPRIEELAQQAVENHDLLQSETALARHNGGTEWLQVWGGTWEARRSICPFANAS